MFFRTGRTKTISTTIDYAYYLEAKKRHFKHNTLWKIGYDKMMGNNVLQDAEVLKLENERRKEEYYKLRQENLKLKQRLTDLEEKGA